MIDALALIIMFAAVLLALTKHFVPAAVVLTLAVVLWRVGKSRRGQLRRARRALERAKRGANTFRPTTTAFPDDSRSWSADSGFGRDK